MISDAIGSFSNLFNPDVLGSALLLNGGSGRSLEAQLFRAFWPPRHPATDVMGWEWRRQNTDHLTIWRSRSHGGVHALLGQEKPDLLEEAISGRLVLPEQMITAG